MLVAPGRPRSVGQTGQALVLFVLTLGLLLGFVALSVDVGLWFHSRREAQKAADAAALAAAQELLDGNPGQVVQAAMDFAARNGFANGPDGTQVLVTHPFDGDDSKVEVVVRRPAEMAFASALDVEQFNITARAVARAKPGDGYAIFSHSANCNKDIDWSGSNTYFDGSVHTNGQLKMSGGGNDITGDVTYTCAVDISGTGNTFGSGPSAAPAVDWPVWFDWEDLAGAGDLGCMFHSSGTLNVGAEDQHWVNNDPSTGVLKPGVYCSAQKINMSRSNISGNVTFIAREYVNVSGGSVNLTPYKDGVLLYSEGVGSAISFSGSGGSWNGLIVAHNGKVNVSGSGNLTLQGGIFAKQVKLSGSNWSMNASAGGSSEVRLVE